MGRVAGLLRRHHAARSGLYLHAHIPPQEAGQGGYLRIVRTGFQKGDGAEKAFIELLGAEKQLDAKRQKRDDVKAKKRAELEKQLEESKKEEAKEEAA